MNELPDDLKALLQRGDPARDVTPALVARVATRLDAPPTTSSWRVVALAAALLTSAALGAGGTLLVQRVLAPPPPAPLPREAPRPVVPIDPLAEEAALLQGALEALQRGDSTKALELLDTRARRFQPGLLEAEARVARVRVLLARGDDEEALRSLALLPESDLTVPLRLSWARLLVARERCDDARSVTATLEPAQAASVLGACAVKGSTP